MLANAKSGKVDTHLNNTVRSAEMSLRRGRHRHNPDRVYKSKALIQEKQRKMVGNRQIQL